MRSWSPRSFPPGCSRAAASWRTAIAPTSTLTFCAGCSPTARARFCCRAGRAADGLSLALRGVHLKSFSGDLPVCMQVGYPAKNEPVSYLDYPSLAEAERSGAFFLRQDIRLLPQLFEVAIHEYARLAGQGWVDPTRVDHLLCHYSSEKFAPVVADLLERSRHEYPAHALVHQSGRARQHRLRVDLHHAGGLPAQPRDPARPADPVLRSRVGTVYRGVPAVRSRRWRQRRPRRRRARSTSRPDVEPARSHHPPSCARTRRTPVGDVLRTLAQVWHDYRSAAWRTPLVHRIVRRQLTRSDYLRWMGCWIPQVREGSRWMRTAVANIGQPFEELARPDRAACGRGAIRLPHPVRRLSAGGREAASIEALRRNPGGEALNSLHVRPRAASAIRSTCSAPSTSSKAPASGSFPRCCRCSRRSSTCRTRCSASSSITAQNDVRHLERWLRAVSLVLARDPRCGERIVRTARTTAQLYLAQLQEVL